MPNSIRTTSNTQNTTNHAPAPFKAGDSVLCPSVGNGTYTLVQKSKDCLTINIGNVECLYRADGRAYHDDCYALPQLFHDTPANRQAIATLYNGNQSNQRKVIDTTEADDKEAVLLSAFDLRDIACDINGAATALYDVGQLLALIHYDKIETHTVPAMARLAHDATDTWASLLYEKLERINDTLALTGYGKEGNQ
ncbi:MAG: hypothetical protein OSA85_08525 [Psychrobacter pacificensis]|uniref:hypothetical protein n=1 Tax=Psychrobacter pacificensis TaxID=112002 RepID=UPI00238BDB22|nr:hypothetical protein [Psychrobacter pacificensis]MDE0844086.1 hypothetical protein [Psychrobacter pacificensis]